MSVRVRHCIECPKCRTRYLIGLSPYRNGSSLVPSGSGTHEAWVLHCYCQSPLARSHWTWDELKTYAVSSEAYRRRYGSPDEIMALTGSDRIPSTLVQALKSSRPPQVQIPIGRTKQ